ncbi:beta-ketoacyl-[acyl-carrier-protein] synthase family protein [Streptomyces sp. NPDC127068]|uniref:beta-ketoacyl-[acyl-carrier-protein] synthase family protein n=1 Tax=Streptomyces sp. NPDC127068 TaxID=3347127 RepID=UPI00366844DF
MSDRTDVVVSGLGIIGPGGLDAATSWDTLCRGEPTARADASLAGQSAQFSCRTPEFDASALLGAQTARRTDRFTHLGIIAAREAVASAGLDPRAWDDARVGVVSGTSMGGTPSYEAQSARMSHNGSSGVSAMTIPMFLPNMLAGHLSLAFGAHGPSFTVNSACASGATAIGTARDLLRLGVCDIVLAGGAEAAVSRQCAAAFARMNALSTRNQEPSLASRPFDTERDGFVLSEGAAMLVLERADGARARDHRPLARIVGYGASADAHHISAPHPQGAGLERAIRKALADADADCSDVDHISAHATSTPLGDIVEARVISRLFPHQPSVTALKGTLGHSLGAASAVEVAVAILTIANSLIPPTANLRQQDPEVPLDVVTGSARPATVRCALKNAAGYGGQNAVLLIAPP